MASNQPDNLRPEDFRQLLQIAKNNQYAAKRTPDTDTNNTEQHIDDPAKPANGDDQI
ncbi:hypothetical protein FC83_GL001799 [Agrilactobacillus composti DSM 18527 = JCM 14202]|uniref:Uncharacterized protein n=1 Tax=Agrilactobacillus composti DSM 18527 = JCM 14202 TaxID=1423734 RepID=X0PLF6_9LACO|nr:hypothetical protein [Agrilactobacillus composti]KRM30663.1 hypothetical protein FC83_GL001799 [Agrilactobacillus composti DSM 18527 = JCM 14202]GAF38242.1 hypothetical protein JCM14202_42 [Agrilactobacillus composti DSM 18527 = JCM 14202]